MLEDFLRRQEVNILFLQEAAHCSIDNVRSHKTYTNVGMAWWSTHVITTKEITMTNITRLPSGRGIALKIEA